MWASKTVWNLQAQRKTAFTCKLFSAGCSWERQGQVRNPKRVLLTAHGYKTLLTSGTFFFFSSKAKAFKLLGEWRNPSCPQGPPRDLPPLGEERKSSLPLGRVDARASAALGGAGHPLASNPRQRYTALREEQKQKPSVSGGQARKLTRVRILHWHKAEVSYH